MGIVSSKKLLALGVLSLALFSCKKASKATSGSVQKGSSDAAREEDFDESKYSNEQRILDPDFGRQVTPPDSPSTFMILESSESDTRVINVNLSLNVWGVGSDSSVVTNLMLQYTPGLALHKHTPKGDNSILDVDGNIIWKADNKPVAQCSYDAMVISSATGTGTVSANPKIPFIGSGGGTSVSFEKAVEDMSLISGSSNFFPIRKGEKIATLQDLCRKIFDAANKEAVDTQLKTLIEKKFIMDEREGFEKVMKAAGGGPKELLTNVNGLEFNVDDVLAKVKNGGKEITGGLKDVGDTVKDKVGGILLTESAADASEPKFDLCFVIHLDIYNTILSEKYDDCHGNPVDEKKAAVTRAIQVAQEIGMTSGQYFFSPKDFPGASLNLK